MSWGCRNESEWDQPFADMLDCQQMAIPKTHYFAGSISVSNDIFMGKVTGVAGTVEINQGRLGWTRVELVRADARSLYYRIGERGAIRKTPLAGRDITWRAVPG
jgi:hypothetical protein